MWPSSFSGNFYFAMLWRRPMSTQITHSLSRWWTTGDDAVVHFVRLRGDNGESDRSNYWSLVLPTPQKTGPPAGKCNHITTTHDEYCSFMSWTVTKFLNILCDTGDGRTGWTKSQVAGHPAIYSCVRCHCSHRWFPANGWVACCVTARTSRMLG